MAFDTNLLQAPIAELAPLLKSRQVSPVELTQAYLDRIAALNPRLCAYITVCTDEALAAAREAEAELGRGSYRGPLHGIPVGVKDQFATKGVRTTAGSRLLAENIPDADATVVARLKAAGTILLGKQNMEEFALRGTRVHPYGDPRNPWDETRIPGHSSSGSGVSVAAALCAAAVGEDTGGSIRNPANVCNLVGIRPTFGRVSRYGVMEGSWSMDTASPIARTVADCALVLQTIAGHDPNDPMSSKRPVPDYVTESRGGIAGLRVGIIKELVLGDSADPDTRTALQQAAAKLQELGATVEEVSVPAVASAGAVFVAICDTDAAHLHYQRLRTVPDMYDASTRGRLLSAALVSANYYNRAQRARHLLRRQLLAALQRFDVLLSPVSARPALRLEEETAPFTSKADVLRRQFDSRSFTTPYSLAAMPALSVPCGFSAGGLPIGMQLGAAPFAEATLFRAAAAYEAATGWHTRHPEL